MTKKRSPIWKIEINLFKDIVAQATSLTAVLKHFNLMNKGGNSNTLKARIKYENIDISHIPLGWGHNKGMKLPKTKAPLDTILVENSTYTRYHLKNRLIKEGVLEYICSECGLSTMWNTKPLVLVLDHINGVSDDNRVENLRFLCPNCHSQTSTFAGRNNKK